WFSFEHLSFRFDAVPQQTPCRREPSRETSQHRRCRSRMGEGRFRVRATSLSRRGQRAMSKLGLKLFCETLTVISMSAEREQHLTRAQMRDFSALADGTIADDRRART